MLCATLARVRRPAVGRLNSGVRAQDGLGGPTQKKAIAEYYKFGTSVRYLQDAKQGFPIDHPMGILHNLRLFFGHLDNIDLHVTKRLTDDLKAILDELSLSPENSCLSGEQAKRLNSAISDIRKTLGAELMGVYAFVITPKIIDTSKLLDAVPSLFGSGVFDSLPEIARYDFTEAARCIAFERATAASFHTLRGTEMVLRQFYCSLIKQKRLFVKGSGSTRPLFA